MCRATPRRPRELPMILALEIIMTLAGLWMLIMGKGWGKEAVSNWQYRLLGLSMLSLWPVMFAAVLIMGIVWAVNHPNVAPEKAAEDMKYPLMGVEFGLVIVYAIIASL